MHIYARVRAVSEEDKIAQLEARIAGMERRVMDASRNAAEAVWAQVFHDTIRDSTWLKNKNGRLYIITTAKKRDTHEWEDDLAHFDLGDTDIHIDSWNNVKKYTNVSESFFIFDEQRVVGYGSWSRAFRRIADSNKWIMLSATPGDDWGDYMSVFIANGYYKNKTDFMNQHAIVTRYGDFPQIRWWNTRKLEMLRDKILVPMPMDRSTTPHELTITNGYDNIKYYLLLTGELRRGFRVRFNPWTHDIIDNASELCQCLRRTVNEDTSRKAMLLAILVLYWGLFSPIPPVKITASAPPIAAM